MKAIATKDIIDINGNVTIEKGKEYEVEQIVRAGYLHPNGYYTNDRIEGYKCNGSLFLADVFEIQSAGRTSKKIKKKGGENSFKEYPKLNNK